MQVWKDRNNNIYTTKTEAQISSFFITIGIGFRYGFPVLLSRFWYSGLALYPFIFLNRRTATEITYEHEKIHIRQQKEMLIVFSYIWYVIELLIKSVYYFSFKKGYYNHSMEREARFFAHDKAYLYYRKRFAFFKYIYL